MKEEAIQTPLHFLSRHLDPSYTWNEWDLRRDAVARVRVTEGAAASAHAQTEVSCLRKEASTSTSYASDVDKKKKSVVVGLKDTSSKKSSQVESVLLEDLLAAI